MKLFSKILFSLVLLLNIQTANAVNLQMFTFSNSPGFATLEDGLLSEGFITTDYQYIVVGSYNYVRAPFIEISGNERKVDIIEWMHTFNFGGAYKFSERFQLGFSSFATFERAIPQDETEDEEKFLLGDSTLDMKLKLFEKNKFAISLTPKIYVPTGNEDYFTGNGSTGFYLGFAVDKVFSFFQLVANVGHKEKTGAKYKEVDHRRQLHFSVGGILPLVGDLDLTAEFFRDTPYNANNDQIPSEANIGVRYNYSNSLAVFSGIGTGSLDETDSTDLRLYAGLKYFPSSKKKTQKILKEESEYGKLYKIDDIFFATGSAELSVDEIRKLNNIVTILKDDPYISKIVLEGYASRIGSYELNKKLSQKRSESVKNYLLFKGMRVQNVQIVAYGNEKADADVLNKRNDRKVMVRIYRTR